MTEKIDITIRLSVKFDSVETFAITPDIWMRVFFPYGRSADVNLSAMGLEEEILGQLKRYMAEMKPPTFRDER